jgi:hypothetical protein
MTNRSPLDEALDPYRSGDLDECARQLRLFLDTEPFALTPRHFLAHVLLRLDQTSLARVHLEKLLPVAVGRGELFRALGIQRRLDAIEGRTDVASRYAAMHRWFRLLGESNLAPAPDRTKPRVLAITLLRLPVEVFAHVAERFRVDRFEPVPSSEPVTGEELWHVLWGATRWRLVAENGRAAAEGRLEEGHQLGGRGQKMRGKLLLSPETPGEWLHMEASLLELIAQFDPTANVDPLFQSEIVRDERPSLPGRRTASDLDRKSSRSARQSGPEPPRLDLTARGFRIQADRDTGDWIEHGQIDLGGGALPPGVGADTADDVPMLDLSAPAPASPPAEDSAPLPSVEAAALPAPEAPQRRATPRVPVSFTARVALLGIGRPDSETLVGDVVDLSMGGVGLRFPREGLQNALSMLQDEALRVDLITLTGGFLQLAGRARWIDFGPDGGPVVSAGVQFALLTEADREAIARLVMESDPGLDTQPSAA